MHAGSLVRDLGRIEAGAKADLCTVDVSGLLVGNGTLPREPWNNLLYANGLSVRNVMTDGNWQVRDGKFMFDDEAQVVARGARGRAEGLVAARRGGFLRSDAAVSAARGEEYHSE